MIDDNWERKPRKIKAVRITQEFLENRSEWPKWFTILAGNKGHNYNYFTQIQGMDILGKLFITRGPSIVVSPGDWIIKEIWDGNDEFGKYNHRDFIRLHRQTTYK